MNPYRENAFTHELACQVELDVVLVNNVHVYASPERPLLINGVKFVAFALLPAGTVFPARRS